MGKHFSDFVQLGGLEFKTLLDRLPEVVSHQVIRIMLRSVIRPSLARRLTDPSVNSSSP